MKRARTQFFIALALLALGLAAYFSWQHTVASASARASALAAAIASAQGVSEALSTHGGHGGLADNQAQVGLYFLTESDVVPFLEALQAAAAAAGAQANVSSVGATQGKSNALSVSLHLTGSFDAVARAAGAIEDAPYDLVENSLIFANDGKGEWHADQVITVGTKGAITTKP